MDTWTTTSSTAAAERVSAFLWKVYAWMAIGLGLTAVVAYAVSSSPDIQRVLVLNRFVFFGLIIAELGLVFFISARAGQLAPPTAAGLFALYSGLNGVRLLSPRLVEYVTRNYTGERVDGYMGMPMHRGLGPHVRGTTDTISRPSSASSGTTTRCSS